MSKYGWTWIEGEDDDTGDSWIQIGQLDKDGHLSEEMAIIMCRDYEQVKREHPEWIENKEGDAGLIVDALNFYVLPPYQHR